MKAIIIDPFLRTITEEDLDNSFSAIYKRMSLGREYVVDCIDAIRVDPRISILLDDNGFSYPPSTQAYFKLNWYPHPLAGVGIVVRNNPDDSEKAPPFIDLQLPINLIKVVVSWPIRSLDPSTEVSTPFA